MKSDEHRANAAKKTPIESLRRPESATSPSVSPLPASAPLVDGSVPSRMPPMPTTPCKFFSMGMDCRNGWRCGFLHADNSSDLSHRVTAKAYGVNIDDVYAIDVECIATGIRHDDRAVCSIALVNSKLETIYYKVIKPSMPIRSYLTPVTGFKPGDLDEGVDLDSALDELYSYLHPNVILVGQAIQNDVAWTRLVKGKHYSEAIDIAHIFKTTSSHGITFFYPLLHTATVLLSGTDHGIVVGESHDPIDRKSVV